MGSGASSSKTSVQPFKQQNSTRRDNGDNDTNTHEQLQDCERKLKLAETQCSDLKSEVERLNHLIAELEGQKLDLEDRLSSLENQIDIYSDEKPSQRNEETLKAKDQIIANLEAQIKANEVNAKKVKAGWRRKLRNYATQLAEEKHSSAIRIMELRQEVYRLTDENERLKNSKEIGPTTDHEPQGKDTLIMELSQKLMEQTETVQRMEQSIHERDKELERLESANSERSQRRGQRRARLSDGTREWSGYSHDSGLDSDVPDSAGLGSRRRPGSGAASLSPLTEKEALTRSPDDADIAEDCNWDAASLDAESEDTLGASPRLLAIAAKHERSRGIILDPDKAQTIDSLLAGHS